MTKKTLRFGIFMNLLEGRFQSRIWMGLNNFCSGKNIDLIIFNGKLLQSFFKRDNQNNIIYDFINNNIVDGLVIPSFLFLFRESMENLLKFMRKFKDIPVVSLGTSIKDTINILVDHESGMRSICEHIIVHHSLKNILYLSGPREHPDSLVRLKVFKKVLDENTIRLNPGLIRYGDFTSQSGELIVRDLINKKIKFDGIIAANDEMAIGAYVVLQENKIMVPKDIIITGFDDIDEMNHLLPPFTTVRQPLYEMGEKAGELLLKKLNNEKIPEEVKLKTEMVVRESCGCLDLSFKKSDKKNIYINKDKKIHQSFFKEKENIIPLLRKVFISDNNFNGSDSELLNDFYDLLIRDIFSDNNSDLFVKYVNNLLIRKTIAGQLNINDWKQSMEIMKDFIYKNLYLESKALSQADEIFYKLDLILLRFIQRIESHKNFNVNRSIWELRQIIQNIRSASRYSELRDILVDNIKIMGIKLIYLFLYENFFENYRTPDFTIPNKAESFVTYKDGEEVAIEKKYIDTRKLIPDEVFSVNKQTTLVVFPLRSEFVHFGYVIYEISKLENFFYEALTEQISSSLYNIYQLERRKQAEDKLRNTLVELQELNNQLHNLSVRDSLTGLYNRRGLDLIGGERFDNINDELFAVFFGDLDGLKIINDTYGHNEGDYAIKTMAHILLNSFKSADVIGRFGGDEFVVIIDHVQSEHDLISITARIHKNIEKFNKNSGKPYNLSISFGHSIFEKDTYSSFPDMIKQADNALYSIKKKKKPYYVIIKS
ncbi:MAG: GGDEF domain-containing protein [Spirochaetales bacterium]|nr:GGDEF domain-containing protein [Spirochaetales bacterium]